MPCRAPRHVGGQAHMARHATQRTAREVTVLDTTNIDTGGGVRWGGVMALPRWGGDMVCITIIRAVGPGGLLLLTLQRTISLSGMRPTTSWSPRALACTPAQHGRCSDHGPVLSTSMVTLLRYTHVPASGSSFLMLWHVIAWTICPSQAVSRRTWRSAFACP